MAYDPNGPWGLRYRVRLAYRAFGDYYTVAALLGVPPLVVERFVEEPAFIPDAPDLASMVAHVADLIPAEPLTDVKSIGAGRNIVYEEAPMWSAFLLDGIVPPDGAYAFKWHYWAQYASGALRSSSVFTYPDDDPGTVGDNLVGGNLDLLATLVWYVRNPSSE